MPTFEEILRIHRLQRVELQTWIEHRWVRPRSGAEGLEFDEADEARIALEVVLALLDQLYATRLVLRKVEAALQALPPALRDEVRARLSIESVR